MCSLAEVCSYVGRAYWQRPLADCRAQRALGFGSNRRILGEAGVWHVVCARWQVWKADAYPASKTRLKNRSSKSVATTSCKLHSLRLVDAQLSRGGCPVIAAPARAESPLPNAAAAANTTGAPKAKKALGAPSKEPTPRQRQQRTEPWPASARRAPTPGRRSSRFRT